MKEVKKRLKFSVLKEMSKREFAKAGFARVGGKKIFHPQPSFKESHKERVVKVVMSNRMRNLDKEFKRGEVKEREEEA